MLLVCVVAGLVTVTLLARGRARLLPMAVVAMFLVSSVLSWSQAGRVAEPWAAVLPAGERDWLDAAVPGGRTVTALNATRECTDFEARDGFYLTEFFNASLARVVTVGVPQDSLPTRRVRVEPDGAVTLLSGRPLVAEYVLAQPGVEVVGRRVAQGTSARLALWETAGRVRLAGVASTAELEAAACTG